MEKTKSRAGEGDQDSWRGIGSIEKEASEQILEGGAEIYGVSIPGRVNSMGIRR